jgi:hypothetical protein
MLQLRTSAGQVNQMSQSLQVEPDAAFRVEPDGDGRLVAVSDGLGKLLGAYHSILESVDGLPVAPVVPSRYRRPGTARRLRGLPRPRWFLRYFVVVHVQSVLGALDRRYSSRAALGLASPADDHDRRAISEFRQGLPPAHTKGLLTALLVLVVLLSQPLLETFAEALTTFGNGAQAVVAVSTDVSSEARARGVNASAVATVRPETRHLMEELKGSVSSSISGTSIADALATLTKAGMRDLLLVLVGLVLALYAILRPVTSGFRLKRMLFNLHPDFDRYRTRVPARWHASRSTGVYRLESALFDELGGPPHREVPVDLIVSAIGLIPLLWVIGVILEIAVSAPDLSLIALQYVVLFTALVAVRARWLLTAWRLRSSLTDAAAAPGWVRLRGSTAVAEARSPSTSGLLALLVVSFSLAPQLGAIGWHRINRELRDLGYAHGSDRLGHFPALSAVAYVMGTSVVYLGFVLLVAIAYAPAWVAWLLGYLVGLSWAAYSVSVYRTHRRVKRALRASVPVRRSGRRDLRRAVLSGAAALLVLLGALVAPLLAMLPGAALYFGFLQARLNKVWARQGTPMVAASQF